MRDAGAVLFARCSAHLSGWSFFQVYGYLTTTQLKIIAVVDDGAVQGIKEAELKAMFQRVHRSYVAYLQNPFSELNQVGRLFVPEATRDQACSSSASEATAPLARRSMLGHACRRTVPLPSSPSVGVSRPPPVPSLPLEES